MGDRANVALVQSKNLTEDTSESMVLYTHSSGYRWPEELRQALEFGRDRWNDDAYLNRILISRMYEDCYKYTTGGGILINSLCDNEYTVIIADINANMVSFATNGDWRKPSSWTHTMSFADFVAQSIATYPDQDQSEVTD